VRVRYKFVLGCLRTRIKRQAVELMIHSGKTQRQVARELDVSEYSLNLWKKAYLGQMKPAQIQGEMKSAEEMAKIIREQHKEIEYLKRQREILSDEHPGRRTESRYAMIEQLSVQYGVKV
jgi:transposase-like protein